MDVTVAKAPATSGKLGLYLRWIARGILIAISALWVVFSIGDGLHDAQESGPMGFIMMLPAAIIVLVTLYVVWRWELAGGVLLLVVTVLGGFAFAFNMQRSNGAESGLVDIVEYLCVFILPFLIPAVLLLVKCKLDAAQKRIEQTS